jgi:hypothetical protein
MRWIPLFVVLSLPICQSVWGKDRLADETLPVARGRPTELLRNQLAAIDQQYTSALRQLSDQARAARDPVGASWVGAWLPPQPVCGERLFVASNLYAPESISLATGSTSTEDSSRVESPWRVAWEGLREQMAQQYYQLATEACQQNQVGLALQLATRAVRENPDHLLARRLLGYQRVGESWGGGYAVRMSAMGQGWNPKYGWVQEESMGRWDAGQRLMGKQWISDEQDKERHATIKEGWHVRTDHYEIVTNHSRLAAVSLAEKLETVYQIWQQLFGEYAFSSKQLLRRIDGKQGTGHSGTGHRRRPFQVRYYRSRREYNDNDHLRRLQPRIDKTLGIYFNSLRQAHFFYGPEQETGTLYHEAVHQLFQEATGPAQKRTTSQLAAQANAWVVEGVACYFESLTEHSIVLRSIQGQSINGHSTPTMSRESPSGEFFSIGTPGAGRLPAARHRRLIDSFYMPLRDFSALSAGDLRQHEQIAKLYSQAAGVATFLMHYREGVYRQPLVQYLRAVYAGRDKLTTLIEVTGQRFEQLDEQYGDFLQRLP